MLSDAKSYIGAVTPIQFYHPYLGNLTHVVRCKVSHWWCDSDADLAPLFRTQLLSDEKRYIDTVSHIEKDLVG